MGIISDIVKDAATIAGAEVTSSVLKGAADGIEALGNASFAAYRKLMILKTPKQNHLFFAKYNGFVEGVFHTDLISDYEIFNEKGERAYYAKGVKDSKRQHIRLYQEKVKVGEIKEKGKSHRHKFSIKYHHPVDYDIYANGAYQGVLKTDMAFFKDIMTLEPRKWSINTSIFADNSVTDKDGKKIATFSTKKFSADSVTTINYPEKENEIIAVLMLLAIHAHDKSVSRMSRKHFDTMLDPE